VSAVKYKLGFISQKTTFFIVTRENLKSYMLNSKGHCINALVFISNFVLLLYNFGVYKIEESLLPHSVSR
jgi:hypothetical protein